MTEVPTQKEIESFTEALVRADLIKESELKDNRHLVVEALKISASKEGLQKVMYNRSDPIGSLPTIEPVISPYNGQVITGTTHEPLEIFTALYNSKKSEKSQKEKQAQDMIDSALRDWYYYERKVPSSQRYNASIGRQIDKTYFLENPIKCIHHSTGCMARFKDMESMQRHRWKHGG